MKRIFPVINTVIAIAAGFIVLIGYFYDGMGMKETRLLFSQWAVILAGVAAFLGILNLVSVHSQKLHQAKPGAVYSAVLLGFMALSFAVSSLADLKPFQDLLYSGIIIPTEVSLMAVLSVTLIYAAIRMLRNRFDLPTILFIGTVLLVLLGAISWPVIGQIPFISAVVNILASGGARGILIGVGLGTLLTGLRILLGADRPYGGK